MCRSIAKCFSWNPAGWRKVADTPWLPFYFIFYHFLSSKMCACTFYPQMLKTLSLASGSIALILHPAAHHQPSILNASANFQGDISHCFQKPGLFSCTKSCTKVKNVSVLHWRGKGDSPLNFDLMLANSLLIRFTSASLLLPENTQCRDRGQPEWNIWLANSGIRQPG